MSQNATAEASISMTASVFRIDWSKRPFFVPTALWLWLGKRRVRFTGRWEHLGEIASTEQGTVQVA